MKAFTVENTQIFYRVFGKGNPILFLHGFLEDHSMWLNIAPNIENLGFQVFLIDLPCHGKSRFSGEKCSMQKMAEILDEFCTYYSLKNPFVFGHSMGGYIGLELLKLRSIKLTLVHSNFWADSEVKKEDRNRFISVVKENKKRLIKEVIPNLFASENRIKHEKDISSLIEKASAIPTAEIITATKGMRDRLNNSFLLKKHKVTIIHGELDEVVKSEKLYAELARINIDQSTVYKILDSGHMSIWENQKKLNNYFKVILFR